MTGTGTGWMMLMDGGIITLDWLGEIRPDFSTLTSAGVRHVIRKVGVYEALDGGAYDILDRYE